MDTRCVIFNLLQMPESRNYYLPAISCLGPLHLSLPWLVFPQSHLCLLCLVQDYVAPNLWLMNISTLLLIIHICRRELQAAKFATLDRLQHNYLTVFCIRAALTARPWSNQRKRLLTARIENSSPFGHRLRIPASHSETRACIIATQHVYIKPKCTCWRSSACSRARGASRFWAS